MAATPFQARALYDFVAEGPNELSFYVDDIFTITSTQAGNQWWYARNSSGQVGSIPANYVEPIYDTSEPTLFQNTHNDTNSEAVNNNSSFNQLQSQSNYEIKMEQQYIPSTLYNDWLPTEPVSLPSDQPNQSNEQEITPSSSFDSSASPAIHENSSYTVPVTYNSYEPYTPVVDPSPPPGSVPTSVVNPLATQTATLDDFDTYYPNYTQASTDVLPSNSYEPYIPVVDPSPPPGSVPTSVVNPLATQTTSLDDFNTYYPNYTEASTDVLTSNSQPSYDLLSQFGYQQTSTLQQQQDPFANNFVFPTTSVNDSIYDAPSPYLLPSTATETTTRQSMPIMSPSLADNRTSLPPPVTATPPKANNDNTVTSTAPKSKPEKTKFFTLKRQKTKPEPEKRSSLVETASEPSPQPATDESGSSGFTDSGSLSRNSIQSPNKPSTASSDAKAPPRARFFDKHGIDNYILHGCKAARADEHVEILYDEKQGGVYWSHNPTAPPFTCNIEDPAKGTKLGGLKSFMEYKIHAQIPGGRVVGRRYKQFDWLYEQLTNKYRFICIPPLPGKQIAGRYENEFIEERRRQLELWLNRICRHPVLCASFPVQHFLTCELTEKNNKDWKAGKRKIEKDELREASWLHCVTFANSNLTDAQIAIQIDAFALQQPGLETHLKNLNQGLTKYLERHTEIYERDMLRLGELFVKLYLAVQLDTTTIGNREMANSMSKISNAYNGVAELYKTKSSDGIRDFNERIQEYIGLLGCFPMILNMQRSGAEFIRGVQQRSPSATTLDFSGAIHRSQVLNHVVLAEINFFQKEKVKNLNSYLKTLLNEQIEFYENITAELRQAAATFN